MTERRTPVKDGLVVISNQQWQDPKLIEFECCCEKGAAMGVKVCPDCLWTTTEYKKDTGAEK